MGLPSRHWADRAPAARPETCLARYLHTRRTRGVPPEGNDMPWKSSPSQPASSPAPGSSATTTNTARRIIVRKIRGVDEDLPRPWFVVLPTERDGQVFWFEFGTVAHAFALRQLENRDTIHRSLAKARGAERIERAARFASDCDAHELGMLA